MICCSQRYDFIEFTPHVFTLIQNISSRLVVFIYYNAFYSIKAELKMNMILVLTRLGFPFSNE